MDPRAVRERFVVDDSIVSCLPGAAYDVTAQHRYSKWKQSIGGTEQLTIEYLIPRIVTPIDLAWPPPFMARAASARTVARQDLVEAVEKLGPWMVPFDLGDGVVTMPEGPERMVQAHRMAFRRELINDTVAELLDDDLPHTSVLDIGCNNGFFSLDIAARGAERVRGVDLRASNIAQAEFVREHYGVENASFAVSDADDLARDQWDVVLNLGVLYHVVNPLQFIRQTYELCRNFAIIDTVVHHEPVAAYFLFGDKDVSLPEEGRENYELHPSYRAAIETIRYAGFRDVIEIVGTAKRPHKFYAEGTRRCFLAIK